MGKIFSHQGDAVHMFVVHFCASACFLKKNLNHYLRSGLIVGSKRGFVWFGLVLDVFSRYLLYSAFRIIWLCILKVYLLLSL